MSMTIARYFTIATCVSLMVAGAAFAGKPTGCKPIQISNDCVIYSGGFCAYQVVTKGKGMKNLNGSCGRAAPCSTCRSPCSR